MTTLNRAAVIGLTAALSFALASPVALATPQSELAQAAQALEGYGDELTKLQDDLASKTSELEDTSYKIGEKQAAIVQTQKDLVAAKKVLRGRMRSMYKSGTTSLLAVVMGADSIEDIINRVYYMDKVAASDAEAISKVREIERRLEAEKADLEQTKTSQQESVDSLKEQVAEYEAKVAEASSYYNALDAQIQQQIAEQQAAEENARIAAALAAREEAEALQRAQQQEAQQQEAQQQETQQQSDQADKADTDARQSTAKDSQSKDDQQAAQKDDQKDEVVADQPQEEPAQQPDEDDDDTNSSSDDTSQGSSVPSGGGLASAYAAIGSPYVYGAAGPSSFDCSGLVCYCYGYGRGRTTYDMIDSLKSTGDWKTDMSQLSAGDLVFTNTGHVGIYTGGGMMVHAPSPGRTVCEASVYSFIGGGSY